MGPGPAVLGPTPTRGSPGPRPRHLSASSENRSKGPPAGRAPGPPGAGFSGDGPPARGNMGMVDGSRPVSPGGKETAGWAPPGGGGNAFPNNPGFQSPRGPTFLLGRPAVFPYATRGARGFPKRQGPGPLGREALTVKTQRRAAASGRVAVKDLPGVSGPINSRSVRVGALPRSRVRRTRPSAGGRPGPGKNLVPTPGNRVSGAVPPDFPGSRPGPGPRKKLWAPRPGPLDCPVAADNGWTVVWPAGKNELIKPPVPHPGPRRRPELPRDRTPAFLRRGRPGIPHPGRSGVPP